MAVDFDAACPPTAPSEISNVQFDKDCNGIVHITQNHDDDNNNNNNNNSNNNGDSVYVFEEEPSQDQDQDQDEVDNHLQIQQSQTHLLSSSGDGEPGFHNADGVDNNGFCEVAEEPAPPSVPLGDPQSLSNPNNASAQLPQLSEPEPEPEPEEEEDEEEEEEEEEEEKDESAATPVQSHDDQSQSHVQTVASSNGDAKEEDTNGFQTNEEEEEEEDNKLEEQTEMDSSVVDTGVVDLDSRINGGKEGGQLGSHTVLHDPTEQLVRENGLDVDIAAHDVDSEAMNGFNANGVHLESETMDWDDKDETNVPACQADIVVVTHNLEEAHEDAATSDTNETQAEYKFVDESVQNSAISAPPAAAVKQIIMFGNISAEYGNAFQTPAKFSALEPVVRDLFVERVETTYTDENASESVNSSIEVQDDVEVVGSCKTQPSPLENASKAAHNFIDAQYEGDQSVSVDSGAKEILEEIEGVESNKSGQSPTESTSIHQPEVQKVEQEVASGPFYLIRIPYLGDKFTNEINLAKLQVDEKTQSREAIRLAIRSKKDTCTDCLAKVEAAKAEERAAKDAFNAKRDEMDSIQTEINRMKNATSIDDIDERILNMEHRIEHETMTLKEEKQLLRDMKQLKNQREQLRATLGKKVEVPPTSEERDKIDEQLKLLKQQLNAARKEMLQAEGVTREAKKIYFDEENKLQELKGQFRAADDIRQEAYLHFQNLKKQLYDKNKYFWKYKEDQRKARDLRGDTLHQLCVNQVESIMDLWNKNDEFRNEYVRCNVNSTLWRLGTSDGRRLGPDEKPPMLHNAVQRKVDNAVVVSEDTNSTSLGTLGAQVEDADSAVNLEHKDPKENTKSVVNLEQSTSAKSKKAAKPIASNITSASGSGREGTDEKAEVNKRTLEDEELARKEEELRKEEAAAKLKELRRSEEMAKAKEANERKKRNALKAKAKAELRAQKEAELKEKEKEKRARKKERKRAVGVESANGGAEGEPASSAELEQPEITTENEVEEKTSTSVAKRHQKPSILVKQTRPLPAPLRNRGRRRMQPWMWVLLVLLVVFALFLVGNSGYIHKFSKSSFGF